MVEATRFIYYGVETTFNGMIFLLKFIKNLSICSKVDGGGQTDRKVIS
jgi:hypothetical protein